MSPANERDVVAAKLKEAQDGAAKQPADGLGKMSATASAPTSSQTDRPSDRGNSTASSSNQQGSGRIVEDGHVSDADSDSVEEIPTTTVAPQQAGVRQTAPSMPAAPMRMPPGMDPAEMQNTMRDPAMMQQMTDMMANMDPVQMESMARMAGAPGAATSCCSNNPCYCAASLMSLVAKCVDRFAVQFDFTGDAVKAWHANVCCVPKICC